MTTYSNDTDQDTHNISIPSPSNNSNNNDYKIVHNSTIYNSTYSTNDIKHTTSTTTPTIVLTTEQIKRLIVSTGITDLTDLELHHLMYTLASRVHSKEKGQNYDQIYAENLVDLLLEMMVDNPHHHHHKQHTNNESKSGINIRRESFTGKDVQGSDDQQLPINSGRSRFTSLFSSPRPSQQQQQRASQEQSEISVPHNQQQQQQQQQQFEYEHINESKVDINDTDTIHAFLPLSSPTPISHNNENDHLLNLLDSHPPSTTTTSINTPKNHPLHTSSSKPSSFHLSAPLTEVNDEVFSPMLSLTRTLNNSAARDPKSTCDRSPNSHSEPGIETDPVEVVGKESVFGLENHDRNL